MQVLNFYSTVFADQMKRGRKTATIRLGDKRHKYRKNQVVLVTVGYQYSPREKLFHAVIDNVEVKRVKDLSPRDIEHDNPEFRRTEELVHFLKQIYDREVALDDTVTVVRLLADRREPAGLPGSPARRRRRSELASSRSSWLRPSASACSCIAEHPAAKIAAPEIAIVGVVESRNGDASHTVRVERTLKGVRRSA